MSQEARGDTPAVYKQREIAKKWLLAKDGGEPDAWLCSTVPSPSDRTTWSF